MDRHQSTIGDIPQKSNSHFSFESQDTEGMQNREIHHKDVVMGDKYPLG